ncbi:restriction endonuclease [Chryseobacterium caseinilyticum]|uniref:Restriction endonuclease n=1 Tax=Chryseobacterium caseinilyticum TaxID=2771428 RepID=A0ABR8ZGP8_9FLAO|nr:restriction endonuclease [Chryseobacterium caseinilyticum]MBD8084488.1 restriction endonuclease [Chryseobacterium caseinilyticum]
MKKGREYELLVERMYRSLEPNAIITHDDHIYDDRAKISRQIDVSIKYQFAGADHLIIVQAKDYKHNANISVVDQFQKVIEDTNANKGILICSKGFSAAALNKAKSYGIECLTVHSALKKNWEVLLKIPTQKIIHDFKLDHSAMVRVVKGQKVSVLPDTFSYDKINIIGITDIIMQEIINKVGWKYLVEKKYHSLDFKKLKIFHAIADEMKPIHSGFIKMEYLKSSRTKFYVEPTDYIFSKDFINSKEKIHNLTLSEEDLFNILENDFIHDKSIKDNSMIDVTVFRFNDGEMIKYLIEFGVNGELRGSFVKKGNVLMQLDDRTKQIMDLENILRKRGTSI